MFDVLKNPEVGVSKTINGLFVVAYDEQGTRLWHTPVPILFVRICGRQEEEQFSLFGIGILEFVDQKSAELSCKMHPDRRGIPEHFRRHDQQVVECQLAGRFPKDCVLFNRFRYERTDYTLQIHVPFGDRRPHELLYAKWNGVQRTTGVRLFRDLIHALRDRVCFLRKPRSFFKHTGFKATGNSAILSFLDQIIHLLQKFSLIPVTANRANLFEHLHVFDQSHDIVFLHGYGHDVFHQRDRFKHFFDGATEIRPIHPMRQNRKMSFSGSGYEVGIQGQRFDT